MKSAEITNRLAAVYALMADFPVDLAERDDGRASLLIDGFVLCPLASLSAGPAGNRAFEAADGLRNYLLRYAAGPCPGPGTKPTGGSTAGSTTVTVKWSIWLSGRSSMRSTLPGTVDDRVLTSGIDLFPTFCNAAGIPTPPHLCGHDFLRQHHGEEPPQEVIFAEAPFSGTMARDSRYKLIRYGDDPVVQLFDMQADPSETRNIAPVNPAVVARLDAAQKQFASSLKPFVARQETTTDDDV